MLPQKPFHRDAGAPLFPSPRVLNSPSPIGHLDQKVNPDVSPDNIWENGSRAATGSGGRHSRCNVKISCPACAAKYSIADEKVQDKLAKIRCRKCGTTIVIDGKVSPPNVFAGEASQVESPAVSDPGHAPSADAGAGSGEYSVDFGDNDQRSMTLADLVAAYNTGEVTTETFIWADGMDDWQPLGQVQSVVDALHSGGAPAPAPAPLPIAAPAAVAFQPPAAAPPWEPKPVESPSAMRAAAKLGGGRGSTSDLFGAYEMAGSEADVTTSAREPSIGLGGAGASAGAGGATGARNESSVLFSLSALTAAAPAKPASSTASAASAISFTGGSTATKEDSGLIDLKALTAASEPQAAAPILSPSPLGMAPPLGLAPPMGGVEAHYAQAPQKSSKTGLFIGGGIAVAAIAIAIAVVVSSQKPPPPAAPVAATQPTPAPTPTPETTQASTAKAPATGTAEEKAPEEKKKVSTGGGRPYKKPAGGETTTTSKPAGETKKPTAAKNPCGCASGDLQCAMKCAAGGG
jgi:predicted Zn finger-like uncharacterized protein